MVRSLVRAAGLALIVSHALGAQRVECSDIPRFWGVADSARTDELRDRLQAEYIDRATPGLRDYLPYIYDAFNLARAVYNDRAKYERVRASTLKACDAAPAIRAVFAKLVSIYPAARFPDVYFVIGRFMTGGVRMPSGVVVAAELYDDPAKLPGIVAHELIHVQQPASNNSETLLVRALREGGADFIGEMISGVNINPAAQSYGRAHEHELWIEFQRAMHGSDYLPWMYTPRTDGKPNDLGYFMGYRIAQAYYEHAADKSKAVQDLIALANVDEILNRSGYNPSR